MGSIGMQELIVIFVIALIVFGPRRLPEIGKTLGRTLGEFRRATNDLQARLEDEVRELEVAERAQAQPPEPNDEGRSNPEATAPTGEEKAS